MLQALVQRAESGGSFNVDLSLNQFNNWYLSLGLHDATTYQQLRAQHPHFHPRFDTELFVLLDMTKKTCIEAGGAGEGELFDPARWTTGEINWGRQGEEARYLDWTRLVSFTSRRGGRDDHPLQLSFEHGSCLPGSHEPEWLAPETNGVAGLST